MRDAAYLISHAKALLIGAGAGMGVDSGLPDFRGDEGFWNAYPQLKKLNLGFTDVANPRGFARDPQRAWGFYGHRFNMYRVVSPHKGFGILKRWVDQKALGGFVYTSNVDGCFTKAGFNDVVECHGSIHHWQCSEPCSDEIFPARNKGMQVSNELRLVDDVPSCKHCGAALRPNILMFGDSRWLSARTDAQYEQYQRWLASVPREQLVVLEIGAGTAVPSVRIECERAGAKLIRINPVEYRVSTPGNIGLPGGALEILTELDNIIRETRLRPKQSRLFGEN